MAAVDDLYDLGPLRLRSGEGRRLELEVPIEAFELGAERYEVTPSLVPVVLDVSRMQGDGWSLRLRLSATLEGPCMRCLQPAAPTYEVDAREVDKPGGGPELDSPYVEGDSVDIRGWAHDALALAVPQQVLCRAECLGLCPECGIDLNRAESDHAHERPPDRRWAVLDELRFDS